MLPEINDQARLVFIDSYTAFYMRSPAAVYRYFPLQISPIPPFIGPLCDVAAALKPNTAGDRDPWLELVWSRNSRKSRVVRIGKGMSMVPSTRVHAAPGPQALDFRQTVLRQVPSGTKPAAPPCFRCRNGILRPYVHHRHAALGLRRPPITDKLLTQHDCTMDVQ